MLGGRGQWIARWKRAVLLGGRELSNECTAGWERDGLLDGR